MKKYFITVVVAAIVATNTNNCAAECAPSGTSCAQCTTYRCNDGYYGTATGATSGCTVCPSNATCAGGNGSVFLCDVGYYRSDNTCAQCPSADGAQGTTSSPGATAITSCYIPYGTSFSDPTGTGYHDGDSYYCN